MGQDVTIIIGLPGSGKTTLMKRLELEPEYQGYGFVDNVYQNYPHRKLKAIEILTYGKSLVVSDIQFCNGEKLSRWIKKYVPSSATIKYIFFKNDAAQCIINATKRNSKDLDYQLELIAEYTKNYNPPMTAIPVWKES